MDESNRFDDDEVAWHAPADRTRMRRLVDDYAAPSIADDPLTRLWKRADASRETGADAVSKIRERNRRAAEKDTRRLGRRG